MRKAWATVATAAILALMLPLEPARAQQACDAPPPLGSAQGRRTVRATPVIALGIIDDRVPDDAHGVFSYVVRIRTYLQGRAGSSIQVTDYGNGSIPLQGLRPGGSIAESTDFVRRFAGEPILVFASPEERPFEGTFATGNCTYTTWGEAKVAALEPMVRQILGQRVAPSGMPRAGIPIAPTLVFGAALTLAGGLLRAAGRATRARA